MHAHSRGDVACGSGGRVRVRAPRDTYVHAGHPGDVPVEELIERRGAVEHPHHVAHLGGIPGEWLIERRGEREHAIHIGHLGGIPVEGLIERRGAPEHPLSPREDEARRKGERPEQARGGMPSTSAGMHPRAIEAWRERGAAMACACMQCTWGACHEEGAGTEGRAIGCGRRMCMDMHALGVCTYT